MIRRAQKRQRKKYAQRRQRSEYPLFVFDKKPDLPLLYLVIAFLIFGAVMVYSSSFIVDEDNPFKFFILQLTWIGIGSVIGAFLYFIHYKFLEKLIIPILAFSILLLLLLLVPGVGKTINGATRWIDLKFFDLQPSEVIKLSFTLYLASWASKQKLYGKIDKETVLEHIKNEIIPFLFTLGVVSLLVLGQPDLATTAIIGSTALGVYFLSGRDILHNMGTFLIMCVLVFSGIIAGFMEPYRFARIQTYLSFLATGEVHDPTGSGYQLRNILIAVGSGGIFGVGFGESRQKFHYLGHTSFSDNIFAIIAEEFGLVGSLIVTSLFMYFLVRGFKIAFNVPDRFGKLLASGITIWITIQAYFHIMANIGLIPVTGIPLPYMSYGGSSMVMVIAATAILLNISRFSEEKNSNI